eukprot:GHVN01002275.1.p1 GENE.GHVN01002275.1~~GHVN01002275.1.p1  ORF type:complete len:2032 (+),score=378.91 GHVN01002275.1:337-6096(+)
MTSTSLTRHIHLHSENEYCLLHCQQSVLRSRLSEVDRRAGKVTGGGGGGGGGGGLVRGGGSSIGPQSHSSLNARLDHNQHHQGGGGGRGGEMASADMVSDLKTLTAIASSWMLKSATLNSSGFEASLTHYLFEKQTQPMIRYLHESLVARAVRTALHSLSIDPPTGARPINGSTHLTRLPHNSSLADLWRPSLAPNTIADPLSLTLPSTSIQLVQSCGDPLTPNADRGVTPYTTSNGTGNGVSVYEALVPVVVEVDAQQNLTSVKATGIPTVVQQGDGSTGTPLYLSHRFTAQLQEPQLTASLMSAPSAQLGEAQQGSTPPKMLPLPRAYSYGAMMALESYSLAGVEGSDHEATRGRWRSTLAFWRRDKKEGEGGGGQEGEAGETDRYGQNNRMVMNQGVRGPINQHSDNHHRTRFIAPGTGMGVHHLGQPSSDLAASILNTLQWHQDYLMQVIIALSTTRFQVLLTSLLSEVKRLTKALTPQTNSRSNESVNGGLTFWNYGPITPRANAITPHGQVGGVGVVDESDDARRDRLGDGRRMIEEEVSEVKNPRGLLKVQRQYGDVLGQLAAVALLCDVMGPVGGLYQPLSEAMSAIVEAIVASPLRVLTPVCVATAATYWKWIWRCGSQRLQNLISVTLTSSWIEMSSSRKGVFAGLEISNENESYDSLHFFLQKLDPTPPSSTVSTGSLPSSSVITSPDHDALRDRQRADCAAAQKAWLDFLEERLMGGVGWAVSVEVFSRIAEILAGCLAATARTPSPPSDEIRYYLTGGVGVAGRYMPVACRDSILRASSLRPEVWAHALGWKWMLLKLVVKLLLPGLQIWEGALSAVEAHQSANGALPHRHTQQSWSDQPHSHPLTSPHTSHPHPESFEDSEERALMYEGVIGSPVWSPCVEGRTAATTDNPGQEGKEVSDGGKGGSGTTRGVPPPHAGSNLEGSSSTSKRSWGCCKIRNSQTKENDKVPVRSQLDNDARGIDTGTSDGSTWPTDYGAGEFDDYPRFAWSMHDPQTVRYIRWVDKSHVGGGRHSHSSASEVDGPLAATKPDTPIEMKLISHTSKLAPITSDSHRVLQERVFVTVLNHFLHNIQWPNPATLTEGGRDWRSVKELVVEQMEQRRALSNMIQVIHALKELRNLVTVRFKGYRLQGGSLPRHLTIGSQHKARRREWVIQLSLLEVLMSDELDRLKAWWGSAVLPPSNTGNGSIEAEAEGGVEGDEDPDTLWAASGVGGGAQAVKFDDAAEAAIDADIEDMGGSVFSLSKLRHRLPQGKRRMWRQLTQLAWDISPVLATQLLGRFPANVSCRAVIKSLVEREPFTLVVCMDTWPFTNYDALELVFPSSKVKPHSSAPSRPIPGRSNSTDVSKGNLKSSTSGTNSQIVTRGYSRIVKFPWLYLSKLPIRIILPMLHKSLHKRITLRRVGIRALEHLPKAVWRFYTIQLIQALRTDPCHLFELAAVDMAKVSTLFGHLLFFAIGPETQPITKSEGRKIPVQQPDALPAICRRLKARIFVDMSLVEREYFLRHFKLYDGLTAISGRLKNVPPEDRSSWIAGELEKYEESIHSGVISSGAPDTDIYLITAPFQRLIRIDVNSGAPMQSAAKAPFRVTFETVQFEGVDASMDRLRRSEFNQPQIARADANAIQQSPKVDGTVGEFSWDESEREGGDSGDHWNSRQQDTNAGPAVNAEGVVERTSCILKLHDDIRQDQLALQIIQLCQVIFCRLGLELWLRPYQCIAHRAASGGVGTEGALGGILECVPDCKSRHQLGKDMDCPLDVYFASKYGPSYAPRYQETQWNFVRSLAAYAVVTFILQIKDRHNGNLMISEEGHIFHIDFGFLFDFSPGGDMRFESAPFKLTREMMDIMGGSSESEPFKVFKHLCVQGYLALRHHSALVLHLVNLMIDSGLPSFKKVTMRNLRCGETTSCKI